ncbi:MAG: DUF2842 domain-containing protein [Rhodospirillales bacterium]|nr:DUF2842 domain-containing protein [Rhodospirillales bacterium]
MPSARSALGLLAIVVFLAGYVLAAATLGGMLPDHWAADLVFYILAGIAWVPVAGRLVRWGAGKPLW